VHGRNRTFAWHLAAYPVSLRLGLPVLPLHHHAHVKIEIGCNTLWSAHRFERLSNTSSIHIPTPKNARNSYCNFCFQLHYRRNRTFFSGRRQHQSSHGIEPYFPPGFHRNRTGYTNIVHVKTEQPPFIAPSLTQAS
jgi:hypothetical protein